MPTKHDYWFPAKRYGWGWGFPVTWQGWATLALWLAAVALAGLKFMPDSIALFITAVVVATTVLFFVCYLKGEPSRWRWGDRS